MLGLKKWAHIQITTTTPLLALGLLLSGCGTFDGLYKGREARCKVNCDPKEADAESAARKLPRTTAPLSLASDYWRSKALEVAGIQENELGPQATALKYTRERDQRTALIELIGSNPITSGPLSLTVALSLLARNAEGIDGTDPANSKLVPKIKCLAEEFWPRPSARGIGFGGLINFGRCLPLVELDQENVRALDYQEAVDVEVKGQPSAEHLSRLVHQPPFRWPTTDAPFTEMEFRAKRINATNYEASNAGIRQNVRNFTYYSLQGTREGDNFSLKYNASSKAMVINGMMHLMKGEVSNPQADSYAGSDGEAFFLQFHYANFSLSGNDVSPSLNLGFTRNAAINGSYFIFVNDMFFIQVTGQGIPCVVRRYRLEVDANGQDVTTDLGTYDLCSG